VCEPCLLDGGVPEAGPRDAVRCAHEVIRGLERRGALRHLRRGELTDQIDYVERAREAEAKIAALERKVGQLTMKA
jgi:hypothetical protein